MQNIIKAGYRITVTSWENDADNYKTKTIDGLSKDDAKFVVKFIKLFSSKNNRNDPGIGNIYEPDDKEMKDANDKVTKLVLEHLVTVDSSESLKPYFNEDGETCSDGWTEYAYELGLYGGDFWTRVMESYTVEFVPQDILIDDVTKDFR